MQIELAVVLAAGEGTRMRSGTAKVLHKVCGQTMLHHVVQSISAINPKSLKIVVGAHKESVEAHIKEIAPSAKTVFQKVRNGTGHATELALANESNAGSVLIMAGDIPLITGMTLVELFEVHQRSKSAATILTATVPDPTGYGRILRDEKGKITHIVEEKEADSATKAIDEINSGIYIFALGKLIEVIGKLERNNSQNELYLTDVIEHLVTANEPVSSYNIPDYVEILGVNDRAKLADCAAIMRDRINEQHMFNGVSIIDPTTTWIDRSVELSKDVTIFPGSALQGNTKVSENCVIGPRTTLVDCNVQAGAQIIESYAIESNIGENANVGPFSYLRSNTQLAANTKVGAYVEVKNSKIGADSKVPHLSYIGDAQIGTGTNIGAATVIVNFDGENKHETKIGNHVRVGSDSMLVAPVNIGDGAYTAAGSVVTEDVPAGALAVARGKQSNILGWVLRKRKGSKSAEAAKSAGASEK